MANGMILPMFHAGENLDGTNELEKSFPVHRQII